MPDFPTGTRRVALALLAAGLAATCAAASDVPVRNVRCYGLTNSAPSQAARADDADADPAKARDKTSKAKKKKDYIVMRARDCAVAGGRLGPQK